MIDAQSLTFGYGRTKVIPNLSCQFKNGEVTGIIGPNGAGKSTLLRLFANLLKPTAGTVLVDGQSASHYKPKPFARQLAFLPQNRPTPAVTVKQLVMMGRYAHESGSQQAVEEALRTVGLQTLADRDTRTLSGGQRQMAYLAMLLAQSAPNVLLDEPFTHLDIGAQLDVAQVIRKMKEDGKCVVVVMHDLTLLDRVCDRAVLLSQGTITFDGSPADCLHSPALQTAFGVSVDQRPSIIFTRR